MASANVLFICLLFLGPLVSISASNWVICWVGIELSFLGLIPLLFLSNSYMSLNKESSLKYFCVQALGSAFLFISGMVMYMGLSDSKIFESMFLLSLCIKLGVFPGHFWVPSVLAGLEWVPSYLLLSIQKVAPLALMANFLGSHTFFQSSALVLGGLSALVGGLIGNNQTSVRAMIGASSVAHTGWVIIGAICGCLWIYFGIYCVVLGLSMFCLWEGNAMASSMSLLSLSGLPPFIMFIGKWSIIKAALWDSVSMSFLVLPLLGTVISLVFYLKFTYSFYLDSTKFKGSSLSSFLSLSMFNFIGVIYLVMVV
uniref:NADH-ubiquinone oxidoreductase chain 2 n=1 Tax=Siphonaria pectinata TaxID=57642 RepID=B3DFE6_9GAST|nr:NADH dehydrogenase subunit 2 [Siphonaria pectinata]ACE62833.1 NADH dehydrogenase subunit 2 [Siphonaria pectinata]